MATERFDLNKAVDQWILKLYPSGNLMKDDLDELKSHLLDQLEEYKEKGLTEEESFWLSKKKLGHPQELNKEFRQVNGERMSRKYLLIFFTAILAYWTLTNLMEIIPQVVGLMVGYDDTLSSHFILNIDFASKLGSLIIAGTVLNFVIGKYDKWMNILFLIIYKKPLKAAGWMIGILIGIISLNISTRIPHFQNLVAHPNAYSIVNTGMEQNSQIMRAGLIIFLIVTSSLLIANSRKGYRLTYRSIIQNGSIPVLSIISLMSIALVIVCGQFRGPQPIEELIATPIIYLFMGIAFSQNRRFPFQVKELILIMPLLLFIGIGLTISDISIDHWLQLAAGGILTSVLGFIIGVIILPQANMDSYEEIRR